MIEFLIEIPLPKRQCVKLEYHALACQFALESVLSRGIRGDVAEFGVNEGDNFVPMSRLLQERLTDGGKKWIYAFDCFQGLPWGEENPNGPNLEKGECYTSLSRFREILDEHGVWEEAILIPGLVEETTEAEEQDDLEFCFAWIDLDLEDSCRVALDYITPRMPEGAIFGIHDYGHPKIPGPEKICNEIERGELHSGKWKRWGPIVGNGCFFERLSD